MDDIPRSVLVAERPAQDVCMAGTLENQGTWPKLSWSEGDQSALWAVWNCSWSVAMETGVTDV